MSGVVIALLLMIGCSSRAEDQRTAENDENFDRIERGRYLATVADCTGCHTIPGGQPFAGGREIETPFGKLISPNITPDRATGIGAWSDAEFDRALRNGRSRDGSRLYPAMPFAYYTKLSQDDVLAIRAYLNSVAPAANRVHPNQLPFPFSIRPLMAVWDGIYFKPGEYRPDSHRSAEWNRGAFLVEGPGHCGACHTPKSMLGGEKSSQRLEGGAIQGWFAPDITNATPQGLGSWQAEDIVSYLKSGHTAVTAASGLMSEEIAYSSSHYTASDLNAIATYLKSLPGHNGAIQGLAQNDPRMRTGAAIYDDLCSACHAKDGKGVPNLFPNLADSAVVRAPDTSTLVRIVLRGTRSVATDDEPTAPAMPSFAWQLSDRQVADVLTYIRNRSSAKASAVSESEVRKLRRKLAARND